MSGILSILSSLCILVVYATYFIQVRKGTSIPNPATWLIWTVVILMNSVTYFTVIHGDWVKTIYTVVAAVCVASLSLFSAAKGKFGRIGWTEWVALALCIFVGILWKTTGDAIVANLALQVILFISFIPTAVGLLKKKLCEGPLPWSLATFAYLLTIVALLLDWQPGNAASLAYPIVNGVMGNGLIAVIAWRQKLAAR